MKPEKKPRPFYGWVMVAAGVVITGGSIGVVSNTLSAFVKPVTEALGFSRGEFTLYNSIMAATGMLALPFLGELYRKADLKRVMLVCAAVLGLVAWGYSAARELWHFYLIAAVHGVVQQGGSFMAVSSILNNWFVDKKGFATGIAMAGTGLFGALAMPVVTRVIGDYGWQWGYRLTGTASLLLLVPTILFVVKVHPADMNQQPLGADRGGAAAGAPLTGFTRAEVLRQRGFWLVMAGYFLVCFVGTSMQGHAMSYLTDIGHSPAAASGFMAVNMAALMIGKIILGAVYDRFGIAAGIVSAAGGFVAAAFLMGYAETPWVAALAVSCQAYGFSSGSMSAGIIASRFFGGKDFARVFATVSLANTSAGIFGQPYPGFVYDMTGSYMPAWSFNIAVALACMAAVIFAQRANNRDWAALRAREAAPKGA